MIPLSEANLTELKEKISCPNYNRTRLQSGIVHIGVGGFHRAHQAYYMHQLIGAHDMPEWGICGVGIREADRRIYEALKGQDGLYTLSIQHPDGATVSEVIGSIHDILLAVDDPTAVIEKMSHPDVKIVSLTITEGGYNFHPDTGAFNFENPDVQHELRFPDQPKTVFGYLLAALRLRRSQGTPPFTILSCDNIQHNGDVAQRMLLTFAKEQDSELADWVEAHVTFPNTMVDRITPVTTADDIAYLENEHGVTDAWPVICEPYIQWVVEDRFCNDRPPLEKLGVQFVADVSPYEKMKIRLLNAGHSVLGIPGAIYGHATITDCMADPVFATFMRQFMDREVTPILDELPGINLDDYKNSLEVRFSNPNIKDHVSRICSESSAKLPSFLLPTIKDNLANDGPIGHATLIISAWCYYSDKGVSENNESITIIDAQKDLLHKAAAGSGLDPISFLTLREVFGDLIDDNRFVNIYEEQLQLLYQGNSIRKLMSDMLER